MNQFHSIRRSVRNSPEKQFFLLSAFWFILIVLLGFGNSFYFRTSPKPLDINLLLHGSLFTIWILFYLTQNILIASRNINLHMLLGKIGVALILLVFISSYYTILYKMSLGNKPFLEAASNLFQIGLGVGAVMISIVYRNRPYFHKRFMFAALVFLTSAGIQRACANLGFAPDSSLVTWLYFAPLIALFLFDLALFKKFTFLSLGLLLFAFLLYYFRVYRIFDTPFGHSVMDLLTKLFIW